MMQRFGTKNLFQMSKMLKTSNIQFVATRTFSNNNNLTIKSNMEQLTGIRLQELQAEAEGKV